MSAWSRRIVLVVALLSLAGCGRLTRTATLNQTTQIPGPVAESALAQQLARQGLTGARVHCAQSVIVYVGTTTTCTLTGAAPHRIVRFTFKNTSGQIAPASVRLAS
jgi:hypothetical protein